MTGVGAGPLLGGPVTHGNSIWIGIVTAETDSWPFRAVRLQRGKWTRGVPLNQGEGSAQGYITTVSGAVVAIWQQHSGLADGTFAASSHIATFGTTPNAPAQRRTLWSERNIGPGDLGIVAARDKGTWLLTMRANVGRPARALRAEVTPGPP